jgi:hypothetical protein
MNRRRRRKRKMKKRRALLPGASNRAKVNHRGRRNIHSCRSWR